MRYFWRVRGFRENGISDVYAEQKFGATFEKDQIDLRKKEQEYELEINNENVLQL